MISLPLHQPIFQLLAYKSYCRIQRYQNYIIQLYYTQHKEWLLQFFDFGRNVQLVYTLVSICITKYLPAVEGTKQMAQLQYIMNFVHLCIWWIFNFFPVLLLRIFPLVGGCNWESWYNSIFMTANGWNM